MKNFIIVVAALAVASLATAMVPPVHEFVLEQVAKADGLHLGKPGTIGQVNVDGDLILNKTTSFGTVALTSAAPSTATVTVRSGSRCACFPQGVTAAIAAAGCATSLSGTTLTLTGPNTVTTTMVYICF